jgi:hypothetical protein
MSFENKVGKVFGRLTVVSIASQNNGVIYWNCKCACGSEKIVKTRSSRLNTGYTRSCGCYKRDRVIESTTKHGHRSKYIKWDKFTKTKYLNPVKMDENYLKIRMEELNTRKGKG